MRGYETFMLKEIHEQPAAVAATLEGALAADGIVLPDLGLDDLELRRLDRITIVGCGTSYHAGLLGRCAIQQWAGVPVDFDIASEYRYGEPRVGAGDLVIGITQSGETADTLAALRMARARGARTVALTNVPGSLATRESDGTLLTRAGNEVGVAATKTFTCQVAALYLLALRLAEVRQSLSRTELERLRCELGELPRRLREVLAGTADQIQATAERFAQAGFFLYMGRQAGLPVALEGALKLKEISYIPCDAYAAGRDEARPDRDALRAHAGRLHRDRVPDPREAAVEHRRGASARRARDRDRERRGGGGRRALRGDRLRAGVRPADRADARRGAAAAAGVPRGEGAGAERRSAAESR